MDTTIALDTSGFAPWEAIVLIKDEIDLFLYDIKLINDDLHKKYTGVSNKQILENFHRLDEERKKLIIRFPVVPGLTDTDSNIHQMINWMQQLSNTKEIHLLPYHEIAIGKYQKLNMEYRLKDLKPPSEERMNELLEKFVDIGFLVSVGG